MSKIDLTVPARAEKSRSAVLPLLRRLHFYIGLFIGPFIFMAALTGSLYVLTPQLENALYAHQLYTSSRGPAEPLSAQIRTAQDFTGGHLRILAVRPAPAVGETSRIMFATADAGPSESMAVFVDPVTLEVRGMLKVYGTSGVLPLRTWLDYLHRSLLLGDVGRNYSELAASWLWVAAIGGVLLWATSRAPRRLQRGESQRGQQIRRHRHWHSTSGLILLLGLVFFSATGLTWSRWAGDNIASLRAHFGWLTPSVNTALPPQTTTPAQDAISAMPAAEPAHAEHRMEGRPAQDAVSAMPAAEAAHAEHRMAAGPAHDAMSMAEDAHAEHRITAMPVDPALAVKINASQFDRVVAAARAAGIDAAKIEVRPAREINKAWTVSEIDRSWPTQVDSVAVDPHSFRVVDKVEFARFGLLAKLTRWGVDAHMGVLFGLLNQLLLAAFGLGLCVMIVLGYRLWWLRRPQAGKGPHPADTLRYCWQQLNLSAKCVLLAIGLTLAISLPVMGISLVILLLIDAAIWQRAVKTQG